MMSDGVGENDDEDVHASLNFNRRQYSGIVNLIALVCRSVSINDFFLLFQAAHIQIPCVVSGTISFLNKNKKKRKKKA